MALLEHFGRYAFDSHGSGIDGSDMWNYYIAPFADFARADPDGFLAELRTLVADDQGGFATFGAARLTWEFYGGECLKMPAALPLIDAGIDFKLARGLPSLRLTGYEQQRLHEREKQPDA